MVLNIVESVARQICHYKSEGYVDEQIVRESAAP